ncbi:hypothetical protein [Pseudomonas mandelii]|jgi:hypothetical protein|uniref:hypothetical protein n=1 Tax=Pseudomonas mandelii TaxID=75612 RepID=UPI003D050452
MQYELLKTYTLQFVYFIAGGSIRFDELSTLIRQTVSIGDFDPMLMPDAPGMPPEFPRLQIFTPEGYKLSASKTRIDFIIDLPLGLGVAETETFKENTSLLTNMMINKGLVFSRVALVNTMFAAQDKAEREILEALTKITPDGISNINIGFTKSSKIGNLSCNDVFNLSNGSISTGETGLVVTRDINTDATAYQTLNQAMILDFIPAAFMAATPHSLQEFVGK